MAVGKVFMSGNSQAVRLPKQFRLATDEVEITQDGERLILDPKKKDMSRLVELLEELSDLIEVPPDLPVQQRDGL